MNKLMVNDYVEFDITGGISIDDFLSKYQEITSKVTLEYEQVSDFKIQCTSGYYNDKENHYQSILVCFRRLETDDEFESRKEQLKYIEEGRKEHEINSMKRLIDNNKEDAIKYIKELNLI